ncbi:MAG: alanine--glyoxylate aminotransferase family protein [Armatimonadota bacterium]|nr:alanine--glyoxylate aminotransferase family protein [Armatimonadota bacterium]MDR7450329.1 alanine--glyoxylate aminotransferase family protein [Armatimonadota bacterium]MDR7467088.1 alanine--glyoxylate aminotransferase family protein [Armatimonadota bacterium]MDR7493370.1 alanine--glyoxylate aminotransferase family protein [Armatimonadota bacterium]MDR7499378.1 alanine--glyoxylate aminotransferase family protein [Armatimonadota bacterium]
MASAPVPERLLLGPGPSPVPQRVLQAMASPVLGHLDSAFLQVMDETMELLRKVFRTQNPLTIPISGTGSAGMEAGVTNLLEPGDRIVVAVAGYFGQRIVEMATRAGAEVTSVSAEWGHPVDLAAVQDAVSRTRPRVLAAVHVETSTGILQDLPPLAEIARRHGAMLMVDAVASLGGVELRVDDWGIDLCYSGSQKCLGAPPGLAPLTAGERVRAHLAARRTKVRSWYFDLSLLSTYWGAERVYHHTAPVSMIYALREALRIVDEEGLERRWARHLESARMLWQGLEELGLRLLAPPAHRAPTLTTVIVPEGVNEAAVRRRLLNDYHIEIAGGLGPLKGQVFRIGLMGAGSTPRNVLTFLSALSEVLKAEGYRPRRPAAV